MFKSESTVYFQTLVETYDDITTKNFYPELNNLMKAIASNQSGLLETTSQSYGTLQLGGGGLTLAESRTLADGSMSRMNINTVANGTVSASTATGFGATKASPGAGAPPPATSPEATLGGPAPYDSAEIRMVGITRHPDTPLGITAARRETPGPNGRIFVDVVIERILAGSPIDKQGMLHVGDIVKEINGEPVGARATLRLCSLLFLFAAHTTVLAVLSTVLMCLLCVLSRLSGDDAAHPAPVRRAGHSEGAARLPRARGPDAGVPARALQLRPGQRHAHPREGGRPQVPGGRHPPGALLDASHVMYTVQCTQCTGTCSVCFNVLPTDSKTLNSGSRIYS